MLASTSGNMSNNGSYGNERSSTVESDYNMDPASGSFFHLDYKKHDDLKEMLDSSKDSLKLEAMKRIIGMVAKGRDASELFPAVVKNVVSKNIEVKKLVYVYLVRYAEEQQDLVLLSISTFQRALKEPNQLIRASALRVLSSIRVTMIVPIVMLAIREAASDMSPYVRKTACHAIPKLYSLDPEQKPELISIIERLLADRTTLVVGSAVMAFTEVCPERSDLIHKNYRKLCSLLVDVDEWGQIVIINMLTRYGRTQFADPNLHQSSDESNKSDESESESSDKLSTPPTLDSDHRLLLRTVRPLLQSRNAAVVMAVAQLYHHTAPAAECQLAARALVRLLRSHTEVQILVLDSIASISVHKKRMFEPYLKSFFVRTSDLTRIKLLKLDILTNLATESNISMILRELRTYLFSNDKQFVAATIQAIGRCACSISDVTDSCLNGLVSLLSSKDEAIVAESVIVIKRLLQTRATEPNEIVAQMAKLLDNITVAQARAAILWLLGEYSHGVRYIAPDVLRKLAKTFCQEHDIVKLQALNLAVKLYSSNSDQTLLLCQYLFNLARYDQNYDIRDRARLLKNFCQPRDIASKPSLANHTESIFLAPKPAPMLQSRFKDRVNLQLGSLSHYINVRANGYEPLPPFPDSPPPGNVRNVEGSTPTASGAENSNPPKTSEQQGFFWDSSNSSSPAPSDSESSDHEEKEQNFSGKETSDYENETDDKDKNSNDSSSSAATDTDESDEASSSTETDSDSDDSEPETKPRHKRPSLPPRSNATESRNNAMKQSTESSKKETVTPSANKSNLDLLLDLDTEISNTITPVLTPSLGGFLTPLAPGSGDQTNVAKYDSKSIQPVGPFYVSYKEVPLLDRISGRGLSISYRFTRSPHLFSPHMVNIALTFANNGNTEISDVKVGKKTLPPGTQVHDFACISVLSPMCSLPGSLGIDFNDSTQSVALEVIYSTDSTVISIKPSIGELLKPVTMSEEVFLSEHTKLRGMNEHTAIIPYNKDVNIPKAIYQVANVALIGNLTEDNYRFGGQTYTSSSLVLIHVIKNEDNLTVTVNCEKIVVGSMLLSDIKTALK